MPADRDHNRLLAALSEAQLAPWLAHLEPVRLSAGQVIQAPGLAAGHVYFPTTALVSLRQPVPNRTPVEVAVVGCDGLVGAPEPMGHESAMAHAVVLGAGAGYRLPAALLLAALQRGDELLRLVMRFGQTLVTQVAQTALCHQHHTPEQQLCRWLLLSVDRLPVDEIDLGQQALDQLLSPPPGGGAAALASLQAMGAVACRDGRLVVLDRSRLVHRACGCHAVVKTACDRLLP